MSIAYNRRRRGFPGKGTRPKHPTATAVIIDGMGHVGYAYARGRVSPYRRPCGAREFLETR
jgi:hypothetical protein